MKPIRILFVNHSNVWGGAETYLYAVLERLSRENFSISIVVPCDGIVVEKYSQLGIKVINLKNRTAGYRFRNLVKLVQISRQYDIVYGNSFCRGIRIVGTAAKIARRPFVWHIHEILKSSPSMNTRFLPYADRVVAVSEASKTSIKPFLSEEEITLISNPIDVPVANVDRELKCKARALLCKTYSIDEDSLLVLSIGRISKEKGIDLLLQIAQQISQDFRNIIFIVVGDWACNKAMVDTQVKRLGLDRNILFTGFQENILPFILAADLLVHPSRQESFGRVIAESLACALPAVAFDVGGTSEIIQDGRTGYLIPPYEIDTFCNKMSALLQNCNLRQSMGILGQAFVRERFSTSKVVDRTEALLLELAAGTYKK